MLLHFITRWLYKRLGVHVDVIPERFIEFAKDGTLVAQLLQNYGVIEPADLQLIEESCQPTMAFDNYTNHIKGWLERIHVEISEGDIYELTHGDGTTAVSLFYELFQKLEGTRNSASFIKRSKQHSFKVEKVSDFKKDDQPFETNVLCEPLLKQWDVIQWERDHLTSIMIKYVKSREDYDAYLENKKKIERDLSLKETAIDKEALGMLKRDKTDYTYEQLIQQQKDAVEMQQFKPNTDEAMAIMKAIRRKKRKRAERNAYRLQLQHELLAEVWKKIEQNEEDQFDKTVCEKLLKQSHHEKEIAEKLFQIREQKEAMIENRKKQDEIDKKQREEEFIRRLFEEELEERLNYHDERAALIAEHKRLYEEKMKLKALKHEKVCKDVAEDIVELTFKIAEYKQKYGMEPDKYTLRNWATLFCHQQLAAEEFVEIKKLTEEEESLQDEITAVEEIGKRRVPRLDVLDEKDLEDYIHFLNLWQIVDESEELLRLMELGMNVVGYVVHKLLLKKYPLPIPQRPNLSPEIEISVCITEMSDLTRLDYLQRLLELRNVKVIQMEDAVNFCIQAYEAENKTEFDEPYPGDDENLKEIAPRKVASKKIGKKGKKEKKGKKGKKDKGSKKSKKDKGSKKGKKDKKKKKGSDSKTEQVQLTFEEKQAQTPRLFPWEKVVLSNKARLGKIAKAENEMGHSIDDSLFADMFVEYLLSLQDAKGWVLINYPNTYEQAAFLEQALTGKVTPKDYYDRVLNKESLSSIEIEEQSIITSTDIENDDQAINEYLAKIKDADEEENENEDVRSATEIVNVSPKDSKHKKDKISEERVSKLLPDLKKLAYSDDEEHIADAETEQSEEKSASLIKSPNTCTCVCEKASRKSSLQEQYFTNISTHSDLLQHPSEVREKRPSRLPIAEQQIKAKSAEEQIMKRLIQDDEQMNDEQTEEQNKANYEDSLLNEMLRGDDSIIENMAKENIATKTSSVKFIKVTTQQPGKSSERQITAMEYEGTTENANEKKPHECACFLAAKEAENVEAQKEDEAKEESIDADEPVSVSDKPIEHIAVEDTHEFNRLSKIVPNPRPIDKQIYTTILTAYIKIVSKEDSIEDEEEYPSPVFKELERKDGLVKFYCDQGCYYILEYLEFNAETIKCLAKMIIGDYSLPLKSSIEIFGERYKEAIFEVGDHKITKKGKGDKKKGKKGKKKKDKKSKSDTKAGKGKKGGKKDKKSKSSKGKKGGKGKKSKSTKSSKSGKGKKGKKGKKEPPPQVEEICHEDKEVQVPVIEEEEEELTPEPRAGEPDWEYVDLPIPEEIMLSLATLWADAESNYVKNFKDVFYNNRVLLNDIVPFLINTKDVMGTFIRRPDDKQYYLREFQKILNEIDLQLRCDAETKSELLCRIDEFREKLLGLCDNKMRESEDERRKYVTGNWFFRQFCELTNNTVVAFQLEIDRFIDTLQVISDYYISIITKSVNEGYEFHKEILSKYSCNEKRSDKFNSIFIEVQNENPPTEFHNYIEETYKITSDFAESVRPLAFKPVAEMKKLFEKEIVEQKRKKPWKKKGGLEKVQRYEPDEDVKENQERIFEEWECAINGEIARLHIQLSVSKNETFNRLNDAIAWIKKIFFEIYENISIRYENELSSVYKACELLTQNVEDETILQPVLILEGDQLTGTRISLCPERAIWPEAECIDGKFKLEQLKFMVDVLTDLAQNGYILKQTFLLLIQDMLYQDDVEETTDTPTVWRNLAIKDLLALLKKLFDDEQYLYWKDFIICNFMIPFPTREELMDTRKQFRDCDPYLTERVTCDDFYNVHFWFEDVEGVNLLLLKSVILKIYQTDKDEFNYTAMLLDFCKDENSILGFVKALELCLGKFVCYDEEMGVEYVVTTLENRQKHEEEVKEHDESIVLAKRAVSLLVDKIMDEDEGGLTLTEVEETIEEKPKAESNVSLDTGKIMVGHKFSYTQIGFEARDDTKIAHFLPLELVLVVISTILSWNLKVEDTESESFQDKIVRIYEECRNEEFNNAVLCHEFLNCEKLKELFETTTKFSSHNPVKLIKQIIEDKPEEVEKGEASAEENAELQMQ